MRRARRYNIELARQLAEGSFTADGLYQDHTGMGGLNPMPYDHFPRQCGCGTAPPPGVDPGVMVGGGAP